MGTFAVSVEHPSAILVGYGPKASVNGEIAQGVHICAFSKENMFWCDGVAGSECHCPGKLLFLRTLRVDRKFRSSPGDATYPVFRSQHQLLLFKVERFGALIDFVGKSLLSGCSSLSSALGSGAANGGDLILPLSIRG